MGKHIHIRDILKYFGGESKLNLFKDVIELRKLLVGEKEKDNAELNNHIGQLLLDPIIKELFNKCKYF
jgi:hypothetical protein